MRRAAARAGAGRRPRRRAATTPRLCDPALGPLLRLRARGLLPCEPDLASRTLLVVRWVSAVYSAIPISDDSISDRVRLYTFAVALHGCVKKLALRRFGLLGRTVAIRAARHAGRFRPQFLWAVFWAQLTWRPVDLARYIVLRCGATGVEVLKACR
jgi:hypothetical protein